MKSSLPFLFLLLLFLNLNESAILAQSQAKRQSRVVPLSARKKQPSELTLGAARSMLVGKKVSIMGTILSGGCLYEWYPVVQHNGEYKRFTTGNYNNLPDSYLGKEAEVVTVQLTSLEKERRGVGSVNALGEIISVLHPVNQAAAERVI